MLSPHVHRCTGAFAHTNTHTHTHVMATHMFLVAVSSAVAGAKSIIGTEVQEGKRLSALFFPLRAIDPILLASSHKPGNGDELKADD